MNHVNRTIFFLIFLFFSKVNAQIAEVKFKLEREKIRDSAAQLVISTNNEIFSGSEEQRFIGKLLRKFSNEDLAYFRPIKCALFQIDNADWRENLDKSSTFPIKSISCSYEAIKVLNRGNKEVSLKDIELIQTDLEEAYSSPAANHVSKDWSRILTKLQQFMREEGMSKINLETFQTIINLFFDATKQRGAFGDVYQIHTTPLRLSKKSLDDRYFMKEISYGQELDISTFFTIPELYNSENLIPSEEQLNLTREEIFELRAISWAAGLLEQDVGLTMDVGGLSGNYYTILPGAAQIKCGSEAYIMGHFVHRLQEKKWLKHFTWVGLSFRGFGLLGHMATVILNPRTGKSFVVDSWFHHGGAPAHIQTLETWLNMKNENIVAPPFKHLGEPHTDQYFQMRMSKPYLGR